MFCLFPQFQFAGFGYESFHLGYGEQPGWIVVKQNQTIGFNNCFASRGQ